MLMISCLYDKSTCIEPLSTVHWQGKSKLFSDIVFLFFLLNLSEDKNESSQCMWNLTEAKCKKYPRNNHFGSINTIESFNKQVMFGSKWYTDHQYLLLQIGCQNNLNKAFLSCLRFVIQRCSQHTI